MLDRISSWLGGMPVPGVVAILVIVALQLALQVTALIDLAKRRSVLYDRKWIWILVIIGGNLLGAIVYWAFARTEAPVEESRVPSPSSSVRERERTERVISELYDSERTE